MNALISFIYRQFDNSEYLLLLGLVFLATTLAILGVTLLVMQRKQLRQRLARFLPQSAAQPQPQPALVDTENSGMVQKLSEPLYKAVTSQNREGHRAGRLKLIRAGFRSRKAYRNYLVLRVFCTLTLGFAALLATSFYRLAPETLAGSVVAALAGFYLPALALKFLTWRRQLEITRVLPDALDLMVVCTEAGLGLDMTFKRVGEELRSLSRVLSDEFRLTVLEIRAGKPRSDSMRNMAVRTGVPEVNNLMTILNQANRFGTSVAKALRVHAEGMRTKRRQIAEEKAAKVAVKLVFPLVLFIFPTLMIVVGGPAFLSIFRILLPALSRGG